jgi:hypothetical protein
MQRVRGTDYQFGFATSRPPVFRTQRSGGVRFRHFGMSAKGCERRRYRQTGKNRTRRLDTKLSNSKLTPYVQRDESGFRPSAMASLQDCNNLLLLSLKVNPSHLLRKLKTGTFSPFSSKASARVKSGPVVVNNEGEPGSSTEAAR